MLNDREDPEGGFEVGQNGEDGRNGVHLQLSCVNIPYSQYRFFCLFGFMQGIGCPSNYSKIAWSRPRAGMVRPGLKEELPG